jgi:hypothetical protein
MQLDAQVEMRPEINDARDAASRVFTEESFIRPGQRGSCGFLLDGQQLNTAS